MPAHSQAGTLFTSDPLTSTSDVASVTFSPDGKTLASGTTEGVVLWDLATRHVIGAPLTGDRAFGSVTSVAFSPDGRVLAAGGDNGAVLWNVSYLADIQARLCARVGRSLTRSEWARYVQPGPAYRRLCP